MKRIIQFIGLVALFFSPAYGQYINMYDYEQAWFNTITRRLKTENEIMSFNFYNLYGDNKNSGKICAVQTYLKSRNDETIELPFGMNPAFSFFGGITACAHVKKWALGTGSFGYGGRTFMGSTLKFNYFTLGGGGYVRINAHEAFEHLDYPISRAYVDKDPEIFQIRPFLFYKWDKKVVINIDAIFGSYFNSDLSLKLINRPSLQFLPGISYESIRVDDFLNQRNVKGLHLTQILNLPKESLFFKGSIGSFYDRQGLGRALKGLFSSSSQDVYYMAEATVKFLVLGFWHKQKTGNGFYFGIGQDDFLSQKLYLKLKYNETILNPIFKNVGRLWSLEAEIYGTGHAK